MKSPAHRQCSISSPPRNLCWKCMRSHDRGSTWPLRSGRGNGSPRLNHHSSAHRRCGLSSRSRFRRWHSPGSLNRLRVRGARSWRRDSVNHPRTSRLLRGPRPSRRRSRSHWYPDLGHSLRRCRCRRGFGLGLDGRCLRLGTSCLSLQELLAFGLSLGLLPLPLSLALLALLLP